MNSNNMKLELVLLLIIGAILIGATSLLASDLKLIKDKSFNVKYGETLYVDASGADIKINSWDREEVLVKIFGNRRAEEKMEFIIEKIREGVKVIAKKKGWSWFNWGGGISVRIEVNVPESFNPYIETSGGDINISSVRGKFNLDTSGGDVDLKNTEGDLKLETSGGDITLTNHKGNSNVSTSGGDIFITKHIGDMKASTSGGDIKIELNDGRISAETSGGDIDITYNGVNKGIQTSTSGGDIHLTIPASFNAKVDLETYGGDIECNFSNSKSTKVSHGTLKADFNSGGEKVICRTSGGDIVVSEK